jgi:Methyltransferase domain
MAPTEDEVPTRGFSASDSLDDRVRSRAHVQTEDDAVLPRKKRQQHSEPQSSNVKSSGNDDAAIADVLELKMEDGLESEASTTNAIANEDTGLHDPSVVSETGPPIEQRVQECINQESIVTGVISVHHAVVDDGLHDEPDIILTTGIQQDDGLDPVELAEILEPPVGAKEIREPQDSARYGSPSRRSPGRSPDKSPEAPARSASVQSASLSSTGEFPDNDFQSLAANLDVDSNETDSTMGEMTQSSTVSLNSELYDHVEENGRSYHRYKQGKYVLPNDETERNRLDLQHHLFLLTLHGELHLAPLKPGIHNVLDIATGTGIWAIEFAAKYPSANVIGTDLSPIQPLFVPPNCHFEVDDAEDDWVYSHNFDYIHGRLLISCFRSFPPIVRKAYTSLQPGGWFELQDTLPLTCLDDSWNGTDVKRWVDLTLEGAARLGMDWHKVGKYKMWLEEAGFIDVQEVQLAWPSNTWARNKHHKLLGIWTNQYASILSIPLIISFLSSRLKSQSLIPENPKRPANPTNRNLMEGLHAVSVAVLTRGLGMTAQEVELLLVGVRKDICNRNIHCYAPIRVIYGRKPGGGSTRVGLGVNLSVGQDEVQIETFT